MKKGKGMGILSMVLVGIVAVEHVYIMALEMFMWEGRARKVFGTTKEEAATTKTLAANQGLYNGFLAAGLFWGLLHPDAMIGWQVQVFFLLCVIVAAVYGAATAKKEILIMQGLPAILALAAVWINYPIPAA